jgi:hypothetical protein
MFLGKIGNFPLPINTVYAPACIKEIGCLFVNEIRQLAPRETACLEAMDKHE